MKLVEMADKPFPTVVDTHYDLALLCSGYEARARFVAEHLNPTRLGRVAILGFASQRENEERVLNDDFFRAQFGQEPLVADAGDDGPMYAVLNEAARAENKPVRILVDYTSMSRLWYAAVVNWARFANHASTIRIDFLYASGAYSSVDAPMVIKDILAIPGFEGMPGGLARSVGVFGLGFDGSAALCVLDRLEPDKVVAFMTPRSEDQTSRRIQNANAEIIAAAETVLECPLGSVEQTYRFLAEALETYRSDSEVFIVPMGPKPHVLASILLASKFPEIGCLRVSREDRPEQIAAAGHVTACTVGFAKRGVDRSIVESWRQSAMA